MELEEARVDINSASVEDFVTRLKGVGKFKAKSIVRFRTTAGKFKKLCELTDVPGINRCILERNQDILLCISSGFTDVTSIGECTDVNNGPSLEEGVLSQTHLKLSGKSEGDDYRELNGEHQDVTLGRRNIGRSLSWENLPSHNKDISIDNHRQLLNLETPSTSIQLEEDSEYANANSTIMRSIRSRSRSKNEERTFGMSTRSTPSTLSSMDNKVTIRSSDSVETSSLSSQPGPSMSTRGQANRSRKVHADKPPIRQPLRSAAISSPNQSGRHSGQENKYRRRTLSCGMDTDCSEDSKQYRPSSKLLREASIKKQQHRAKRKRTLQNLDDIYNNQMKRKLDSRLDLEKLQSPEKKACKSLRNPLNLPAINDSKSTQSGDEDISEQTREKEICLAKTSPNRFISEAITTPNAIFAKSVPIEVDGLADWLVKFQKWNSKERISAIDQLIDVCEPRQVRHMLGVIEPQFQRDFISLLPKELALHVLSFLEPKDVLVAAQTCRYWHILAEDDLLWREKCVEEGITEPYYPKVCKIAWKNKKTSNLNGNIAQPSAWKASLLRHHQIEENWKNGELKSARHLKGHDDHVITCLQFSGTRIVSGSDDNTLKVWSSISGKCLRTLTGHTGGVWASQMRKNMIISGSTDRTLKIWNADTGNCTHTLHGHTSTVRCMALHDNIVVSGSRDATLRVWNVDTGECLHVLTGHMAAVRCVCYDGKLVVSGAYDYNVKVWDPIKEECLHTLQGHTNRVYSLQFDAVHVVSGSLDTSIRVWSVKTGACLHTLVGHQSLTSGMELKNNILVSGNADSTVKMWDIVSGKCLKTLEGPNKHQSAVTCLQFCGKFVITSSDDGTVKLWDVKSGKAVRDLVSLESRGSGGVVWRIRASQTKLVCAVGSRNGTEETKLLVLDFDPDSKS